MNDMNTLESNVTLVKRGHDVTEKKDMYVITLKGQVKLIPDSQFGGMYPETADIEVRILGVEQKELLRYNGLYDMGSAKNVVLKKVQTTFDDFDEGGEGEEVKEVSEK